MKYAVAVGIYITSYVLVTILALLFVSAGSVIRVAIFSIPVLLVGPRVVQRFTDGTPLLPEAFRNEGGFLLGGGAVLIWIGHLAFFGTIAAAIFFSVQGTAGVPVGIFAGLVAYPYLLGIVLVEVSFRGWSSRQPEQAWKSKRNQIIVVVGLIVMAHLVLATIGVLTGKRVRDLLSYTEREALAWGLGYAREVKRNAEKFYIAEKRMPCINDKYINVDSLLRGTKADRSKALSIKILDCGRFVVTIHRPIDGVADGQLLFVASPGDADAGTPLEWKCFSAHHARIERHTKGRCTYDPSLASTLPAPTEAPPVRVPAIESPRRPDGLGPTIQHHLDRLAEPTLWKNCEIDEKIYRLVEVSAGQSVAAVRIWHDLDEHLVRTISSSRPNQTMGAIGPVGKRMFGFLEARFDAADFWNLPSERNARRPDGVQIYLEACRYGEYHVVKRQPGDRDVASTMEIFNTVRD